MIIWPAPWGARCKQWCLGGRKQLQGVPRAATTCPSCCYLPGERSGCGRCRRSRRGSKQAGRRWNGELQTGTQPRLSQGTSTEPGGTPLEKGVPQLKAKKRSTTPLSCSSPEPSPIAGRALPLLAARPAVWFRSFDLPPAAAAFLPLHGARWEQVSYSSLRKQHFNPPFLGDTIHTA